MKVLVRKYSHLTRLVVLEEREQADLAAPVDAAQDGHVGAVTEPDRAVEDVGGGVASEQQVHQLLSAVAVSTDNRGGWHVHVSLYAAASVTASSTTISPKRLNMQKSQNTLSKLQTLVNSNSCGGGHG